MKKQAFFAFIISLALTACNQNKPADQIPVVNAAIDSVAIAQDTFQQKSLEQSYEYAQTVMVNPKLVYDIRAYDGPATHGKYCIIRRGPDNKPDTVVEGERNGFIANAFTADLNNNGKEEIYVVIKSLYPLTSSHILAFEFNKDGVSTPLVFDESPDVNFSSKFHADSLNYSADTIYAQKDALFKWQKYKLPHMWKLHGTEFKTFTL